MYACSYMCMCTYACTHIHTCAHTHTLVEAPSSPSPCTNTIMISPVLRDVLSNFTSSLSSNWLLLARVATQLSALRMPASDGRHREGEETAAQRRPATMPAIALVSPASSPAFPAASHPVIKSGLSNTSALRGRRRVPSSEKVFFLQERSLLLRSESPQW